MHNASPAAIQFSGPQVSIAPSKTPMSIVRVRKPDLDVLARLSEMFGGWPMEPTSIANDVYWLGPQDFAVLGRADAEVAALAARACTGFNHHVAHVAEGYTLWCIAGARARDVLTRGCSLDLHPSVFGRGRCAGTLFAQIGVFVARSADDFEILADVSYDGHLALWFENVLRDLDDHLDATSAR